MTGFTGTEASEINPKWALAYLNGRARAFQRGNVPLAAVRGAVRVALRHQVTFHELTATLADYRLVWDSGRQVVHTF
jgi:hypothetical protein